MGDMLKGKSGSTKGFLSLKGNPKCRHFLVVPFPLHLPWVDLDWLNLTWLGSLCFALLFSFSHSISPFPPMAFLFKSQVCIQQPFKVCIYTHTFYAFMHTIPQCRPPSFIITFLHTNSNTTTLYHFRFSFNNTIYYLHHVYIDTFTK